MNYIMQGVQKMPDTETIIYVICSIIVVAIISICAVIYTKHLKIVKEKSEYYKEVLRLNQVFFFYSDISSLYRFHETCASKRRLDALSLEDALISTIDGNAAFFENLMSHIQQNKQNYEVYCKYFDSLRSKITEEKIKDSKIKLKTFIWIEKNLCNGLKQNPKMSTSIHIKVSYTSPKEKNSYSKERTFSYKEVADIYANFRQSKNQQIAYSYQVKIERAKMTDSLRYDILRRDGFKCQICGATAQEGAKLHVDHIFPVSRGGKTVTSNLRTLCDRCNMGKSNKIE